MLQPSIFDISLRRGNVSSGRYRRQLICSIKFRRVSTDFPGFPQCALPVSFPPTFCSCLWHKERPRGLRSRATTAFKLTTIRLASILRRCRSTRGAVRARRGILRGVTQTREEDENESEGERQTRSRVRQKGLNTGVDSVGTRRVDTSELYTSRGRNRLGRMRNEPNARRDERGKEWELDWRQDESGVLGMAWTWSVRAASAGL